jgi:hypothetical protein
MISESIQVGAGSASSGAARVDPEGQLLDQALL